MKKDSFLAFALLLFVALGCEPSNDANSRPDSRPAYNQGTGSGQQGTGSGQQGTGSGQGPVSVSGPDRPDYGPSRDPYENDHNYRLQQQGRAGPCAAAWDYLYASYFNWKNGAVTEGQYRDAAQRYEACVAQNYRR